MNNCELLSPVAGRPVKGVSFDLWLTLLRPSKNGRRARGEAIAKALGTEADDDFIAMTQAANEELDSFSARTGIDRSCEERVALVASKLGLSTPSAETLSRAASACQKAVLENLPELIEPNLPKTLETLVARGLKIVTVSNTGYPTGSTMREVLKQLGIARHLSGMLFSDEIGRAKPHPEIFKAAEKILGCAASEILHIGDSPEADVAGGTAAGFRVARFIPGAANDDRSVGSVSSLIR